MEIAGPIRFGVLQHPDRPGYDLHMTFTAEFRALDLAGQGASLRNYLGNLNRIIPGLPPDDRNRAGMLIVQQLVEEMLPHIEAGEMALEETVVVEIGSENPFGSLAALLS
jgi:hypothetical protein